MSKGSHHRFAGKPRRRSRLALVLALAAPLVGTGLIAIGLSTQAAARTLTVELREDRTAGIRVVQGKSQNLRTSGAFVDLVVVHGEALDGRLLLSA